MYQFDWSVIYASEYTVKLYEGLLTTLKLAFISLGFSLALGIPTGVGRLQRNIIIRSMCASYVEFLRNTPPIVQILFWYFSVSYLFPPVILNWLIEHGLKFSAAVIALSTYTSAFMAEIVRAGIQSIPRGQMEAGYSIGLSYLQVLRYVTLPQVFRTILPPMINQFVALIKNTAFALAIGVAELSTQARIISAYTFRGVEAFTAVTLIYLVLCLVTSAIANLLGRKFKSDIKIA
jgi:polar amino acid transport system permease protein